MKVKVVTVMVCILCGKSIPSRASVRQNWLSSVVWLGTALVSNSNESGIRVGFAVQLSLLSSLMSRSYPLIDISCTKYLFKGMKRITNLRTFV